MNITTLLKRGVLIVRVEGELDMHVADKFRQIVDNALETSGVKHILFNLEAVNFIDFMLSPEGMGIFRKNGQKPLVPLIAEPVMKLPPKLLKYFAKADKN